MHSEKEIINEFLEVSNLSWKDLIGKSRKQELVIARHCMWYSLRCQKLELKYIGKMFNRTHSTVSNGLNRVSDYIFTKDAIINPYIEQLNKFSNKN